MVKMDTSIRMMIAVCALCALACAVSFVRWRRLGKDWKRQNSPSRQCWFGVTLFSGGAAAAALFGIWLLYLSLH